MKEEFLNIVALIVRQMSEGHDSPYKGRSILEGLLDEGYDPVEIDDALSWFEGLAGHVEELGGVEFWPGFRGVRLQSELERELISPEAFGYVVRLSEAGVIDEAVREAVLDKICELSMPGFGLAHVKALLGLVLYSKQDKAPEELLRLLGEGRLRGRLN